MRKLLQLRVASYCWLRRSSEHTSVHDSSAPWPVSSPWGRWECRWNRSRPQEHTSPAQAAANSPPPPTHLELARLRRRAAHGRGRVSPPTEEAHWPLAGAGHCLVPREGARAGGGSCDRGYGVVTLGRRRRGGGERAAEQPCNRR